jgi:hypothetical protein
VQAIRRSKQRELPGFLLLVHKAALALDVQHMGTVVKKDGSDEFVPVTLAVIALGAHDGRAALGSQFKQSIHSLPKGRAGAKLVDVATCALRLAAQEIAQPAIGEARRFQCSGKVLAIRLRHVATVWSAPHIDHEFNAVLTQEAHEGISLMITVTHCVESNSPRISQIGLLRAFFPVLTGPRRVIC